MRNRTKRANMTDRWEFVLVRLRDDYNTSVSVPKSECPTIASAIARVHEEFPLDKWRIGLAPEQNTDSEPSS